MVAGRNFFGDRQILSRDLATISLPNLQQLKGENPLSTLIIVPAPSPGLTLYTHLMDQAGQRFNYPSDQFQGYSSGQWGNYSAALSEQGASAVYLGNMPGSAAPQELILLVYQQAGGSPAEGDTLLKSQPLYWEGGDLVGLLSRAKQIDLLAVGAGLSEVLDILPATTAGFADVVLDQANGVETSITPRQALRLLLAALAGKLSGSPAGPILIRNAGDTKTRINATVDENGNRTAVSYDTSA